MIDKTFAGDLKKCFNESAETENNKFQCEEEYNEYRYSINNTIDGRFSLNICDEDGDDVNWDVSKFGDSVDKSIKKLKETAKKVIDHDRKMLGMYEMKQYGSSHYVKSMKEYLNELFDADFDVYSEDGNITEYECEPIHNIVPVTEKDLRKLEKTIFNDTGMKYSISFDYYNSDGVLTTDLSTDTVIKVTVKEIRDDINEAKEQKSVEDLMKEIAPELSEIEKSAGIVLDSDLDEQGDGSYFFDTNYNPKSLETDTERREIEAKYEDTLETFFNKNGYEIFRSDDEDATLSFWIYQKENPVDVTKGNFLDDEEKMRDFKELSKEEFLKSYSYLSEEEYDNTAKLFKEGKINESVSVIDELSLKGMKSLNVSAKRLDRIMKQGENLTEFAEKISSFAESAAENLRSGYDPDKVIKAYRGVSRRVNEVKKWLEVIDQEVAMLKEEGTNIPIEVAELEKKLKAEN